ncbi:MAG: hypothetical protein IKL73_06420 [Lachnospiraceae bacterium]|nr:hypothetical protein [Lachnospiraceae bacterium]
MNKKKIAIIIGIVAVVIAIVVACVFFIAPLFMEDEDYDDSETKKKTEATTKDVVDKEPDNEQDKEEDKEQEEEEIPAEPIEPVELTSLQKLNADYSEGKLTADEYFSQLLCLANNAESLNEKYKSENKAPMTAGELGLEIFYKGHKNELSDEVKKAFIEYAFQIDVAIGEKNEAAEAAPMAFITTNEDQSAVKNHTLDKVCLSKNGNFLIWYTEEGLDAITKEDAIGIGNRMEDAILVYEQTFGESYTYNPKVDDRLFNNDYSHAKKVMENCEVDLSSLENAMSVYVYDTGSENVLATHFYWLELGLDWNDFWGNFDNDGIINYPYVRVNQRGINDNKESLYQVVAHELFHQYQSAYAEEKINAFYPAGQVLYESAASYASALVSQTTSIDTYLNGWSGRYAQNINVNIKNIAAEYGGVGYPVFPYLYSYAQNVSDGNAKILKAHLEAEELLHLQGYATQEELAKASNHLAFSMLSKNYTNKAFIPDKSVAMKCALEHNTTYNETIAAAAVNYYKLTPYMNIKVSLINDDYLHFNIFGKKGEDWEILIGNTQSIDMSTYQYKDYDEIYLAVANANLLSDSVYTIEMGDELYSSNGGTFNTAIDNYSLTATMTMTMSGIKTTSVMTGKVDELHQKEYLKTQVKAFGMVVSSVETYTDFARGITYTSVPTTSGTQWQREDGASYLVDMLGIIDNLNSMENVEEIDTNHYRIKLNTEEMSGLLESGDNNSSAVRGSIDVDVYVSNGYITKMEYDFTSLFSGFDEYTTTILFSNYNTAGDVQIPQRIIDEANNN